MFRIANDHAQRHSGKYAWVGICIGCVAVFEGYSPKMYYDSVHVPTICYGATKADGVDLTKVYTKQQCEDMLGKDLPKYDAPLQVCIKKEVYDALPPYRHAALVSLAYNIGTSAVCNSSVVRDLNRGDVKAACDDFLKFNRAGGRVLQGLVNRREAERKMCLQED